MADADTETFSDGCQWEGLTDALLTAAPQFTVGSESRPSVKVQRDF